MNEPIIELKGLTKSYGSVRAVDQLDLTIYKGEIFGLLGPNGAGKTTSILMMLGLTEPTAGTAYVCGKNATRNPIGVKKKVGYLPDNVGFYDSMTALENLSFIARLNGHAPLDAEKKAISMLEQVGLSNDIHKKTGAYSRGMKQRLGLADVLIKDPEVVILDEPTLGIDPSGVSEFLALIKQLSRQQGLTVLLSSHHLQQVQRVCDRVGIFVGGKLLVEGNIDTLARNLLNKEGYTTSVSLQEVYQDTQLFESALYHLEGVRTVAVRGDVIETVCDRDMTPEIVRTLVNNGADIVAVHKKDYALDDIYEKYFENNKTENYTHEKSDRLFGKSLFRKRKSNV
jgi:ABC-2 type transport system ATP-binding protein